MRLAPLCLAAAAAAACSSPALAVLPAPTVTYSTVGTAAATNGGHFANSINSVAINRNNLVTAGGFQYIAYYDQFRSLTGPDDQASVMLGRRAVGSSTWSLFDTNLQPYDINDDHDNVALAVDGNGKLHLSWGMHNHAMNYRVSTGSATGTWSAAALGLTAHSFWAGTAATNDSSVTYPEFYNVPNSKDLLFVYRQGASGYGDTYFARYDAETNTFEKNSPIAGSVTNVNAYLNRLAYDDAGVLKATWTWRSTPAFQTNHNTVYGESPDGGVTWRNQAGVNYALPITEANAQIVVPIPEQSTLINQSTMTLDNDGNPVLATWYAPRAAQGDHTRQYMLNYFEDGLWKTSQITDRPTEAKQGDSTVRDLARPIVVVDDAGRTLVVMRYKDSASSANGGTPTSTTNNGLVVAISSDNQTWEFVTLAAADLGVYEPTFDAALWERDNKLSLFYQPLGTNGSPTVQVLEWDARAYFAALPEPASGGVAALVALGLGRRWRRSAVPAR